jgi:hypothetical protein
MHKWLILVRYNNLRNLISERGELYILTVLLMHSNRKLPYDKMLSAPQMVAVTGE